MTKYMLKITCLALSVLFITINAHADLKTLMELGKSQGEIAKALKNETKIYDKVKKAIESGKLKEGEEAEAIRKNYGEPVIDVFDKKRDAIKWLYMPATSSHFEGEKLYLFIDKDDKLVGWQLIE
ncbi:MAG: hypothetical protein ISS26_04755 [Candidatus Omnitrophica bacterium]|nr:hypothetical protein [Candidatus Omnitrophota bacterium]